MDVLVVTAVDAERDAIVAALPAGASARIETVGVGTAEAAAATSALLAAGRPELVLLAGIAGGFPPLEPGGIAVASAIVQADLGGQTGDPDRPFAAASELGFGIDHYAVEPKLAVELADRTGGRLGTVLTVSTVTGTAERAAELLGRHPDAVAEAMEGAGVAAAAARHGVAVAEVRAVSNAVGPRDRGAWRIPDALAALAAAVAAILGAEV